MFGLLKDRRLRARGLFPYWDGSRRRWADPFAVYRALASGDPKLPDIAEAVDEGKEPETGQAVDLICRAFDVGRWNGATGLTDTEILALIAQMDEFVEGAKKNSSPGPT